MKYQNNNPLNLPNIEIVSAKVHEAWIKSKLAQGVTSRKSETGEEMMVPYNQLSEKCKDLDRNTVKAVYEAIISVGFSLDEEKEYSSAIGNRDTL